MQFKQTQLDNGLTMIAEVNESAKSMAAGFFVRTGSRDETPEVAGVSHFLEHMTFKGTERRTAADVSREFDELGANYNAFTSEENTLYYGAVLPEFQTRLVDLLGDMLRPALRDEDFDMEKNVIVDEIARYQDQPQFRVYEKLMSEHFRGHPLGNSVLGSAESITAMKRDDMRAYFDRRYSPGNVTAVAVGKVDWHAFVEKTTDMCSHWKPFDVSRQTAECSGTGTRGTIVDGKVAREHVGIMSPAPSGQDDARFAAQLLATVLGDTTGSRLFYALIEPAIADEASTTYDMLDGTGGFLTFISADGDRAAEAVEIAHAEFRKLMDDGPTETELDAAKNKIASAATLRGELPMGRLTAVGFDWVYRREYVPLAEQIDTLFAVTVDEVLAVARAYDLTRTTVLGLGPVEKL